MPRLLTPPPVAPLAGLPPSLLKPVQFLKGVGPQRAALMARMGITNLWDLINHLPRVHEDRTRLTPLARLKPGAPATVSASVEHFEVAHVGRQLGLGRAVLRDESGGFAVAVWFRRITPRYDAFAGLRQKLTPKVRVLLHGWVERNRHEFHIRVEEMEMAPSDTGPTLHMGRWVPVYELTEGLNGRWLRERLWEALPAADDVPESLPASLLEEHNLPPLAWAYRQAHFPASAAEAAQARRRLAFDEFFFLELALAQLRRDREKGPPAAPCRPTRTLLTPFRAALGFDFTPGQKQVIKDIFSDMEKTTPMSRLLQGDVGSGKTVVALAAMLLCVENGRQACLMAPTEILAEQHFRTMGKFLSGLAVRPALVTRHGTAKERAAQRERLASGEIDLAVGTHALLEDAVAFKNLGLAVVDEQHRFGVRQRARLTAKAQAPHTLIMTATPIPRTLALTLYGDLSVSTIQQPPPGRPVLTTHWTLEENAFDSLRRAVAQGGQGFVVYPLVEESEKLDLRAAVKEWDRLKRQVFPDLRVGLLHGQMKPSEKDQAMALFQKGETQVLVATPVVEVGIDVPNASMMVIMHAERFGLAQLHQLRGRVGRGVRPSACYLVSSARGEEASARLRLMCQTRDGFRLAEEDLKLRGPGEFLGEAQHGVIPLKAGDLVRDGDLIEETREAALALLADDPLLKKPAHAGLGEALRIRFSGRFALGRTA